MSWHNFGTTDQVEWSLENRKDWEESSGLKPHQESPAYEKVKAVWRGVSIPF